MIRSLILAAVACVALSGAAFADDVMASRYDNTTKATNAKGEVTKVWYAKDGTFTGDANGTAIKGTWELKDNTVCLTQVEPAPAADAPTNRCNPITAHNVGDTWEIGEGDAKISLELLAGKQ